MRLMLSRRKSPPNLKTALWDGEKTEDKTGQKHLLKIEDASAY